MIFDGSLAADAASSFLTTTMSYVVTLRISRAHRCLLAFPMENVVDIMEMLEEISLSWWFFPAAGLFPSLHPLTGYVRLPLASMIDFTTRMPIMQYYRPDFRRKCRICRRPPDIAPPLSLRNLPRELVRDAAWCFAADGSRPLTLPAQGRQSSCFYMPTLRPRRRVKWVVV